MVYLPSVFALSVSIRCILREYRVSVIKRTNSHCTKVSMPLTAKSNLKKMLWSFEDVETNIVLQHKGWTNENSHLMLRDIWCSWR